MGSSVTVGRIAGIPIRAHISFLIVLPFLAYLFAQHFVTAASLVGIPAETVGGDRYLWGLGIALALFISVLIHELAHSLYARLRGGRVAEITLLMIGGVSQIEEAPTRTRDEAVMAALGPLTSLLLAALFYSIGGAAPKEEWEVRFALMCIGHLNLILGVFNLLPAFPMDGGRILRAVLASRMGIARATAAAAIVGKAFALLFGAWGFVTMNFVLLLVAWFVWIGAEGEASQIVVKRALETISARDLLAPAPMTLDSASRVAESIPEFLRDRHLAIPVSDQGDFLGMLSVDDVAPIPDRERHDMAVAELVREARPVREDAPAWEALREMNRINVPELAVLDADGSIAGVIRRSDVEQLLRLQRLREKPRPTWLRQRRTT